MNETNERKNERRNERTKRNELKKRRRMRDHDLGKVLFFNIHFVLFEGAVMLIDQISIQGKPGTTKSVSLCYLKTSTDGANFSYITKGSDTMVK